MAAKYRNKATGETWSGRGLQPRWLKAALASGKKLDGLRRLSDSAALAVRDGERQRVR